MKNNFFLFFKSKIKINIKGRKIERFIKRLADNKINIYNMEMINRNEANIVILKSDYLKVLNIKSIYEFNIVGGTGMIKIRKTLKLNSLILVFLVIGIIVLQILSRMIFSIEVVHTDKSIRNKMLSELEKYGLKIHAFKKNYDEVQKIKEQILTNHKDDIEWLEIENIGTKYIVRLEERKIKNNEESNEKRHVIASKNAIIKKIEAENGEIVKEINSYVNAGDIIISGNITLNEQVKNTVSASGHVYGEVWYKVKVDYPLAYSEKHETGNSQKILVFNFLNKSYELGFKKYKDKNVSSKTLLKHIFLPISLTYDNQRELIVIDEVYTIEQAIKKAEERAYSEINSKLNDKEKILSSKNLKVDVNDSKIELEMFFTVYEDITEYQKIEENIVEE